MANLDVLGLEKSESIDRLKSVEIDDDALQKEIRDYWAARLGGAVSAEEIQAFHGWLFDLTQQYGYLSYAETAIKKSSDGSVLEVYIVRPHIRAVRVISLSTELQNKFASLITQRLKNSIMMGRPLDTKALDQRLDTACFDLPIELDATVRAAAKDEVDLIINISPSTVPKGKVLSALAQMNNFGLTAYGIPQVLGFVSIGGFQPKSTLSLIGQASKGISYGRIEYDFADAASRGHWRVWSSGSKTQSILGGSTAIKGSSLEMGFGHRSQITEGLRDYRFQESADFVVRKSQTYLSSTGDLMSELRDYQLRFRESMDNSQWNTAPASVDLTLTFGGYDQLANQSIELLYAKLDVNLRQERALDFERNWYFVLGLKAQVNSGRLDSHNQMALGGVDGVRAYTSIDGMGDRGLVMNLELNRRLANGMTVGAFYDAGSIRLLSANPFTEYGGRYSLQALGLKWSGTYKHWVANASLAKGVGGYKAWTDYNIESKPNNWRLYSSLTYRF